MPKIIILGLGNRNKLFISDYGGLVGNAKGHATRPCEPIPENFTLWKCQFENTNVFFHVLIDENGDLWANDENDPHYPNIPNKIRKVDVAFDNDSSYWWRRITR